jgi:hypothetical protein
MKGGWFRAELAVDPAVDAARLAARATRPDGRKREKW